MLYTENLDGKDAYEQDRMGALNGYLFEIRRYKRPLSTNLYTVGDAMFGQGQTYSRGGLTLHMLRRELGDNVFFGGLSRYLKSHAYQPVATSDLIKSLSEAAGHDLTPWFDQWVFKPGHPIVDWSWSYDDAGKYTVLHLKQTQDTSDGTPIYSTPLRVAILLPTGAHRKSPVVETTVTLDKAEQEIRIPGSVKPDSVIIDPEHDLLMETKGPGPSDAELPAQLRFAPSYQERLRAARRLTAGDKGKDDATVKMLTDALSVETSDIAAVGILNVLADTKKESLRSVFRAQAASSQPARRAAALVALGTLPATPEDVTLLRQLAISDTEPYALVENALRGLSHMGAASNLDVFEHQVESQSTRDRLANTVVSLLGEAKLDAGVPVLLKAAAPGRTAFLRRSAIRAIGTLAPQNADVHTALIAASKSEGQTFVQTAAIDALKTRKDMAALDTLKDLAANATDSTVRSSAQDAVTELSTK
jgi:aminopeptidase N